MWLGKGWCHKHLTPRTKINCPAMNQGLFVFGSKSHILRSCSVLWFLSSDPWCLQGWYPRGVIHPVPHSHHCPLLHAVVPACQKEMALGYPSSVTPCVSTMDIFDCPFQFQLMLVPQAALLVDCFCDLCGSRRVQGSFIFKPGERWKSHGSKISCRARCEHQRGENVIVLLRHDDVRQVLMLGDFFNCVICLKTRKSFGKWKEGKWVR